MMRTAPLALGVLTWILSGESARREDREISNPATSKNRCSVNGCDRDLSGGPRGFCQRPAFPA